MSRRSGRSKSYSDREEEETNNYGAEPEDELDDEEQEITRCICGQDELNPELINPNVSALLQNEYQIKIDQGLFIQCDKCSVWQHGYCVGLFINEDVPDKYWCELCKPDFHVLVYENGEAVRSLYKSVNDKRKKLQLESIEKDASNTRLRSKRLTPLSNTSSTNSTNQTATSTTAPNSNNNNAANNNNNNNNNSKYHRKERRHYDDNYDEQLQKALRESAKESGLKFDSDKDTSKKVKEDINDDSSKEMSPSRQSSKRRATYKEDSPTKRVKTENEKSESDLNELDESNMEEDNETSSSKSIIPKRSKQRAKLGTKSKANPKRATTPKSDSKKNNQPALSKEELINQSSKPRYVNEKSSIYELRKRTGAILEWLGRSQIELEEEKVGKIELFDYKEKPENEKDEKKLIEENIKIVNSFNENLALMEKLTESILNWEQQFGKYAPRN